MSEICPTSLAPGSTIGILGGGQLGRMLALSALKLGFHIHIFCPQENSPAFEVARKYWQADFDDMTALDEFALSCDVITFEFENIPDSALERVSRHTPVFPDKKALQVSQDRLHEKAFLTSLGIPVAPFMKIESILDLALAMERLGDDCLLKTRRLGYDGKGQFAVQENSDPKTLWKQLNDQPAILEKKVDFIREISVLVVRSQAELVHYDVCENLHLDQMLRRTRVPAAIPEYIQTRANDIADQITVALDYTGVLAIEMFMMKEEDDDLSLLVNEIAPRVHNSGHWTECACITSQFDNHIRAIANWPLGSTRRHSDIVMTNIIGEDALNWQSLAADTDTSLHLYGKEDPRPGRKMGHTTLVLPLKDIMTPKN